MAMSALTNAEENASLPLPTDNILSVVNTQEAEQICEDKASTKKRSKISSHSKRKRKSKRDASEEQENKRDVNADRPASRRSAKAATVSKKKTYSNRDFDRPNPLHPVTLSDSATFSDTNMSFDAAKMCVSNEKGYRLCKTTHGVDRSGTWFFEAVLPSTASGFFRIGWAQILAEPHAPVGYDEYSYAYASKTGNAFHVSRGFPFAATYGAGDVIGCLLHIPPSPAIQDANDEDHEKLLGAIQRTFPPLKEGIFDVTLAVCPGSFVSFYKNGQALGRSHENLYDAKYYPAVSIYKGGPVALNLGPDFHFAPVDVDNLQPVSSLFDVQDSMKTEGASQQASEVAADQHVPESVLENGAPIVESAVDEDDSVLQPLQNL